MTRVFNFMFVLFLVTASPLGFAQVQGFNIPAGSLSAALDAFEQQSDVTLQYPADAIRGKQSPGVSGRMNKQDALRQMLAGSGVTFQTSADNTITLTTAPQIGEQTLAPISVQGETEDVYAPVDGYVAVRSTAATKSDTPLIETPQSVSVVTRDQLEVQDVNSLAEALRYTPGIQAEAFGFEPRTTFLRIRGFDATATGLYQDSLQLRSGSFSPEPYSAERIEVPRGPASVLYGQGSPGGLVNIVSKRPTQEPLREVGLEIGTFGRYEGKFDLSGPIDEAGVFSYRLTGLARESDTQVDFINDDRLFIAPAFSYRPSDDTTVTLLAQYKEDQTLSSQALPAAGTLRSNPNGDIPFSRFTGEPGYDQFDRDDLSVTYLLEHRASDVWTFRQNARFYQNKVDDVSAYSSGFQADQRTLERMAFEDFTDIQGFALDNQAQISINTGPAHHTLVAGIDFQTVASDSFQNFGAAPTLDIIDPVYGAEITGLDNITDQKLTQTQTGFYLQDQIKFFEKIVLSLGGRYDQAENKVDDNLFGADNDQDDSAITGRAGLLYLADNGLAPYISYSESFLPSIEVDQQTGRPFDPETGEQYEVGIKYQPPRANAFVTLSAFELTRQDFIQTNPSANPGDPDRRVQTGEVRSRGVELEGVASLNNNLNLIMAYTYLDNQVTESADPALIGKALTQTPEHYASLFVDYTLRAGQLSGLGLGVGVRYLGSNFGDFANTVKAPDATVADAVVHYDWRNIRLAVNAKNLLGKDYVASCFTRGVDDFCTIGQQRQVTGSIRYRW